jgi:enoyl-CoA hydratase/carnithine racemase
MKSGLVPGDGIHCALQELLNLKPANYAMLTCHPIDAEKALEWGLVNEVVPKEKIYERAWELGRELMQTDRIQRRIATQILRKPWKRRLAEDLHGGFASEMFAYNVTDALHSSKSRKKLMEDAGIKIDER